MAHSLIFYMSPFKMRSNFFKNPTVEVRGGDAHTSAIDPEINPTHGDIELPSSGDVDLDATKTPSDSAQGGVKQVEAITLIWTKPSLITAYAW